MPPSEAYGYADLAGSTKADRPVDRLPVWIWIVALLMLAAAIVALISTI